jgi:hypothetical protein
MSDPQLMKIFDFDESDLQANRNGRISARQMKSLKSEDASSNALARNVGIVLIVGSFAGIALLWNALSLDGSLFGLAGCLAPILIGAFFLRIGLRKTSFTLAKVEGKANIVMETAYSPTLERDETRVILHVGESAFEIESEAAGFVFQGEPYVVYFVHETDTILSIEKIERERR